MSLITLENISKSFGERTLFHEISFSVEENDKIGVIGVNGTGKSTLLKIIAGVEQSDDGNILKKNGLRISYLPQTPVFLPEATVMEHVFSHCLTKKPENLEEWTIESEAKIILTKLGITDFDAKIATLSGGQKKRVALANALVSPVDILILDEPTNHIDADMVEWLEKYLKRDSKALIMVTHDRYFLDRVANRTLELSHGKLYSYQANYSQFLELKAQREELEAAGERKRQNFLRRELAWVRRGAQARSTKQKARLERFEQVSSQKGPEENKNVEMGSVASRLGKKTVELKNIVKSYDGVTYIDDFSYILLRNDRIGITGKNGCGKSTLIKILNGQLQPDQGEVIWGDTVKIGVFAQEAVEMDSSQRVIDYIRDVSEYVATATGKLSASQMLETFLFPLDMQRSPISTLSGGEKRRLYLLRVLMAAPNILVLDEPTNDLDIETLAILEDYLEDFPGAVIAVSHDRYFLDKIAGRMFAFLGNGKIKQFEGGYSDYMAAYEQMEEEEKPVEKARPSQPSRERKPTKLSFSDQRELDGMEDAVMELENKLSEVNEAISQCTSDYVLLQELTEKQQKLSDTLEQTMERYIYLSELAEEMEKNRLEEINSRKQ